MGESITATSVQSFAEKAYLEYAMYVILDRALPHVADGLKPVQRRIIYAMSELGLNASAKYKKSARTVGDVLGKFHPHGDSACYEAMVLMAQPFSHRYPLVDGQGNWGSVDDPRSFAAMRYTESRLTRYADLLLQELGKETVDWQANFDGTLQEPMLLPARIPQLLLNGASGIAVGMATDIPPHNLREVVKACVHLLKHPDADDQAIGRLIPAPDYPGGGELLTPASELQRMYQVGHGSMRLRARWHEENGDLVVSELPHQVPPGRIMEQIAKQMEQKKLPMVSNLRDESDHEHSVRLVIELRSRRVDGHRVMSHLLATTDLEKTYRFNLNVINRQRRPEVMSLRTLLNEWLGFRRETVTRGFSARLDKLQNRLHLLAGLYIAYLNLDEVIRIIREEDHPKAQLINQFQLSDAQADAILETRLRHLTRLEEMKIRQEQDKLTEEQTSLQNYLDNEQAMTDYIIEQLRRDARQFGDERRTVLNEQATPASALDESDFLPNEPITVVLSRSGWLRAGKGDLDAANLNYRSGDGYQAHAVGHSQDQLVILDDQGRSYTTSAHDLASARSYGEPLTGRLNPPDGAQFLHLLLCPKQDRQIMLVQSSGYGFIGSSEPMVSRGKAGKQLITLTEGSTPLPPLPIHQDHQWLACVSHDGYLLVIALEEINAMNRGKGVRLMKPGPGQKTPALLAVALLTAKSQLKVVCANQSRTFKPEEWQQYVQNRDRRGQKLPRGYQKPVGLQTPYGEQEDIFTLVG